MKRLPVCICGVIGCFALFGAHFGAQADGESQALADNGTRNMTRKVIRDADAPRSPLYSQAVIVGRDIYVTGTLGVDPRTSKVAGPTIQAQTRQALVNCQSILRAAGATLDDVVEVQVLLARPGDFDGLNEAYAKFFTTDPPIRSVTRLGPELPEILVSIKMHAILTDS
jgi:reactive intermediate/imine deaminase